MVDATTSFSNDHGISKTAAGPACSAAATGLDSGSLDLYESFAARGGGGPAQSAAWVRAWAANVRPDGIVATLSRDGQPVLALALEAVSAGPFRTLRFMGGSHCNGNFPAGDAAAMASVTAADITRLCREIRAARPDIDLIRLERLADDIGGARNPLLQCRHAPSPNVALAVDLAGGFEGVLERMSGKRKRKKHRSQTRKFEAAGGFRRIEAETPQEADRLLDAFFAMKERRFRKMGIADVFSSAEVRAFFRDLFTADLARRSRHFFLHALEVGGVLRAVTGSSVCGKRLICEFGAIADDELAPVSPGDFLFFENIKEATEQGFEIYDFSVGDEPYKRLWCTLETTQFDVLLPLSVKGRLWAHALGGIGAAKARIKSDPHLWALVKRLRRRVAGSGAQAAAAEAED